MKTDKTKAKLKIGLALGGGGAKGLAHIEFLKVFDKLNIKPAVISGTSMGSLIGALYASGMDAKKIEEIALNFKLFDFFRNIDVSFGSKGLIKGKKIKEWIEEHIKVKNFKDLEIPMKIIAVDFWNRKEKVFEKGDLIEAIRSSISIPGIFEPVVYEEKTYVDGGVLNQVPYDKIKNDCDVLIAINVLNFNKTNKKSDQLPSIIVNIINSLYMMGAAVEKKKSEALQPDIYIKTKKLNKIGILEFHRMKDVPKLVLEEKNAFEKDLNMFLTKRDKETAIDKNF